jgi:hypothetical protein
LIADVLAEARKDGLSKKLVEELGKRFGSALTRTNPQFNYPRFMAAVMEDE